MATKTFYLQSNTRNAQGYLDMAETLPGADAVGATGWVVAKLAPTVYSPMSCGTEQSSATFAAGQQPSTSPPASSLGVGNAFRTASPLSGSFANAAWQMHAVVRAVSAGGAQDGRFRFRMWKSANADGSSATDLIGSDQFGGGLLNIATTADMDNSTNYTPGAVTLTNEYLFIVGAWEIDGAGSSNSADVDIVVRAAGTGTRVITPDFTPAAGPTGPKAGTLAMLGVGR